MKLVNPFKWIDDKLSAKYIPKPPVHRHIVRRRLRGEDDLVLQEYITSVGVEGVIYYEDLRKLANELLYIASLNRTGEGY